MSKGKDLNTMVIKFLDFEKYHHRKNVGSTKIRVHNLIKYWDEASLYKYGDAPDVLIFQKVYMSQDYRFHEHYKGIKILDICDPDWLDNAYIKATVEAVDGVVVPTEPLARFIRNISDKPVRVIKDRFDLSEFPEPKVHKGQAKKLVWFGYSHNAQTLQYAVSTIKKMGFELTVVAESNPHLERYGDIETTYLKYNPETIYSELKKHDIALLPKGGRPQDLYKSENKTIISELIGLPVATTKEDLEFYLDENNRNIHELITEIRQEYDCQKSVQEYREFISELKR